MARVEDAVFPTAVLDSIVQAAIASGPSGVEGPRTWNNLRVVWRVDRVDTSMVSPLASVGEQIDLALAEDKRKREEEDGRAHFEAHRANYRTKDKVEIDYIAVHIPPADSVAIPEADLRKFYQAHLAEFRQEEQVRSRHILISNNPAQTPGGEAAAKARIDSLETLIRGGADFEAIARDFSQDPSNAGQGGDLGFFERGRMVKEFSDTAFTVPIGRVSRPVSTQFGWHLIRTDERRPAGVRPFAEVRSSSSSSSARRAAIRPRASARTRSAARSSREAIRRSSPLGSAAWRTPRRSSRPRRCRASASGPSS